MKNRPPGSNNGVNWPAICDSIGVHDMTAYLRPFGVLAVLAGLAISGRALADKASSVADIPAKLIVEDNAKMFSPSAIDKAKKLVSEAKGFVEREVHVETYEKLSEADQKRYDDAKSPEAVKNFWKEWTKGKAPA